MVDRMENIFSFHVKFNIGQDLRNDSSMCYTYEVGKLVESLCVSRGCLIVL